MVLAVAGDTVRLDHNGVTINGRQAPNTRPLARDAAGRRLTPAPYGTYVLRDGQAWLWSPYSYRSFDSRYFGPVPRRGLVSVLRPVLITASACHFPPA